jgi:nucleosome assembly protein 1-like 1
MPILILFLFFSTEIDWYHGKCLAQKVLKKKHRKASNMTTPITKTEKRESFFNFFSPHQDYDIDEEKDQDTVSKIFTCSYGSTRIN